MNQEKTNIKRALISVSDKQGIIEFAKGLHEHGVEIISTGGTSTLLRAAGIPVIDVAEITGFPEIMDGRVKTLHPKVQGGILGLRDKHAEIAAAHAIPWIDLVVVNLYPFAETLKKSQVTLDDALENIDVGGPTMLRAAAKNMGWVGVIVDPVDYTLLLDELHRTQQLSFATRRHLAAKAFAHTAHYDALISAYLAPHPFPEILNISLTKQAVLRYGENPHQAACAYQGSAGSGILSAQQYQGKEMSYNNIADTDAAWQCVREFARPACVVVKHATPCGVAEGNDIAEVLHRALQADAQSAFGGIVALNRLCTVEIAQALAKIFIEVLIAPAYDPEALAVLAQKPNLRVLCLPLGLEQKLRHEIKFIQDGLLMQDQDRGELNAKDLQVVTALKPSEHLLQDLLFAWHVVKHVKSNAILIAKNQTTLGVGAGQVSRIDAVDIAVRKAGEGLSGAVLASDAFFPFRDSIERIAQTGIVAIIQPGGSLRDEEVIAACNKYKIAMVFTGKRCFKH